MFFSQFHFALDLEVFLPKVFSVSTGSVCRLLHSCAPTWIVKAEEKQHLTKAVCYKTKLLLLDDRGLERKKVRQGELEKSKKKKLGHTPCYEN